MADGCISTYQTRHYIKAYLCKFSLIPTVEKSTNTILCVIKIMVFDETIPGIYVRKLGTYINAFVIETSRVKKILTPCKDRWDDR